MVSRTVPRTVWPLAMNRPTSCQPMNPVAPATHFGESVCFSPDDMNADPSSSQRRHTPADRHDQACCLLRRSIRFSGSGALAMPQPPAVVVTAGASVVTAGAVVSVVSSPDDTFISTAISTTIATIASTTPMIVPKADPRFCVT